jgi:hypothetical protein
VKLKKAKKNKKKKKKKKNRTKVWFIWHDFFRQMDGCSFALTKEDYAIRDLFLGDAGATADFAAALALAASCNSPFATWLIETCDGANDLTSKAAVSSFLLSKKDWTAKAFGVVLSEDWDISLLREPASHGCAFAQAVLAFFLPAGDEKTEFARKSAFVGERNGLFIHGMCLCETDAAGAKRALRKAAELVKLSSFRVFF